MKDNKFFDKYDLKFNHLKLGDHAFAFSVDDEFMGFYEASIIDNVNAEIKLNLQKQSDSLYVLNFNISGNLGLSCDRCLSELDFPFSVDHRMLMKVVDDVELQEYDEDVIYISSDDFKINLADSIYEIVGMQVPMKVECAILEKDCDHQMLKKLEKLSKKDSDKDIDPRWDSLKDLGNLKS